LAQHVDAMVTENSMKSGGNPLNRWLGAIILFIVGYVHIALFLNMMSFRLLPFLFLINGVGAFIAMIGVLVNSRWVGWIFGIVMSGGAAIVKIAMNTIPGVGAFLMGMPTRMNRPKTQMGNGGMGGGHAAPPQGGQMHSVLPLFTDIMTLATISIVIELVFVVLAIYVLTVNKRNLAKM
jgi:hypothetical protein